MFAETARFIKYVWTEEGVSGKIGVCIVIPAAVGCVVGILLFLVDAGGSKVENTSGTVETRVYRPSQQSKRDVKQPVIATPEAYLVIVKLDSGQVVSCGVIATLWAQCHEGQRVGVRVFSGSLRMRVSYQVTDVYGEE